MLFTGVNNTGDKLFIVVNVTDVKNTGAYTLCPVFILITSVVDTGNKLIAGVIDTGNKLSPVSIPRHL
jgi:hypothetical protein